MYKIVYIDDSVDNRDKFASSLISQGLIEINAIAPDKFEETISFLKTQELDGLILDLRLDEMHGGKQFASYTAPSLSQGIRSELSKSDAAFKSEFPIFLLTSQSNLANSYEADLSSHGLFDDIFFKKDLGDKGPLYERVICSHVEAYKIISEERDFEKLLNHTLDSLPDDLIPSKYLLKEKTITSYEVSQYIIGHLLRNSGPLISEDVLAARLGVEIKTSEDWNKLLEILGAISYSGVYGELYTRWWASDLLNWWRNEFPSITPLINLEAEIRVSHLKEKFGLTNLTAASVAEHAIGTKFWTVCSALKFPLDTADGFLLEDYDAKSWHDKKYTSLLAIVERKLGERNLITHPYEKDRIIAAKQNLKS